MSETRSVSKVIDRLLSVVPSDETELRFRLTKIQDDSWFSPPEGRWRDFAKVRDALLDRFGDGEPEEGWPMRVSEIIRGAG